MRLFDEIFVKLLWGPDISLISKGCESVRDSSQLSPLFTISSYFL